MAMTEISQDEAAFIEKIRQLDPKANQALRMYLDTLVAGKMDVSDA